MLHFLLDTGCLIAAQTPADRFHEPAVRLVDLGRQGEVELSVATTVDYDLESATPDRIEERRTWLSERPFIGRVPGPATFDVSRFDLGDVLVSDEQGEALGRLRAALGKSPVGEPDNRWRREQFDLHHLGAASLADVDALVTTDVHDLLRRRGTIQATVGLSVLSPAEAIGLLGPPDDDSLA